jgi:hypothetical protein
VSVEESHAALLGTWREIAEGLTLQTFPKKNRCRHITHSPVARDLHSTMETEQSHIERAET